MRCGIAFSPSHLLATPSSRTLSVGEKERVNGFEEVIMVLRVETFLLGLSGTSKSFLSDVTASCNLSRRMKSVHFEFDGFAKSKCPIEVDCHPIKRV